MPEEIKKEQPKEKKGLFQKAKDAILPDADEQAAIISTAVRLGVLVWSGGILTLNYVAIPGVHTTEDRSNFYSFGFYWSFS